MATNNTISEYFAEPNLPQQYTESLGAPFGDRYVYTIFMQGINVLPEIPSSAEGSELTARVKEVNGNQFRITEYYFIKQEGEWVTDGDPKTISEWTEEPSGGGGNVILNINDDNLVNGTTPVTLMDLAEMLLNNKVPWVQSEASLLPYMSSRGGSTSVFATFGNVNETIEFGASSPTEPLVRGGGEQH